MVWVTVNDKRNTKISYKSSDYSMLNGRVRAQKTHKKQISILKGLTLCLLTFGVIGLSGCSSSSKLNKYGVKTSERVYDSKKALPKTKGYYKVGKPYKVAGKRYYPRVDKSYNKTGKASWYGDDFHGRKTANGEIFDMHAMTAAHKTLPMPSLVKVTNLSNGKKIIVRVNDRGPYHGGRIIDLSRAAATALGYRGKGVTNVRVEYYGEASLDASKDRQKIASNGSTGNAVKNPKRGFFDHVFGWNKPKFVAESASLAVIPNKLTLSDKPKPTTRSLKLSDMQEYDPDIGGAIEPNNGLKLTKASYQSDLSLKDDARIEDVSANNEASSSFTQVAMFKDIKQAVEYKKQLGSSVYSKIDIKNSFGKTVYLVMVRA